MSDTETVTLRKPVDWGEGDKVVALTFRRGRLGDMKGIKVTGEPPAESLMLLASRLCGQPLPMIERLDPEDAGEVMGIALRFFAKCLSTGNVA